MYMIFIYKSVILREGVGPQAEMTQGPVWGSTPHAYQNASPTTSAAVSAPVSVSAAPVVSA